MQYEVNFLEDSTGTTLVVEAPDEETAIFVAGMNFPADDYNPERISLVTVKSLSETAYV